MDWVMEIEVGFHLSVSVLGGRRDDRRDDLQPCMALPVGVSPSSSAMLPAVRLISAVRPTVPTRVCTAAGIDSQPARLCLACFLTEHVFPLAAGVSSGLP